jgi:hypothetical protein
MKAQKKGPIQGTMLGNIVPHQESKKEIKDEW